LREVGVVSAFGFFRRWHFAWGYITHAATSSHG